MPAAHNKRQGQRRKGRQGCRRCKYHQKQGNPRATCQPPPTCVCAVAAHQHHGRHLPVLHLIDGSVHKAPLDLQGGQQLVYFRWLGSVQQGLRVHKPPLDLQEGATGGGMKRWAGCGYWACNSSTDGGQQAAASSTASYGTAAASCGTAAAPVPGSRDSEALQSPPSCCSASGRCPAGRLTKEATTSSAMRCDSKMLACRPRAALACL